MGRKAINMGRKYTKGKWYGTKGNEYGKRQV